jgi:hypothetical protein
MADHSIGNHIVEVNCRLQKRKKIYLRALCFMLLLLFSIIPLFLLILVFHSYSIDCSMLQAGKFRVIPPLGSLIVSVNLIFPATPCLRRLLSL